MKNTRRIDVKVTAEDISIGRCGDSSSCMMARAIVRYVKDNCSVRVYNSDGAVFAAPLDIKPITRFVLSHAARAAIRKFDKNRGVKPATFRITLPTSVLR